MKRLMLVVLLPFLSLLASCRTVSGNTSLSSAPPSDSNRSQARADTIHATIVKQMNSKFPDTKDKIWFESFASFEPDWIVQSPENYWGKVGKDLPKNLSCEKGEAGCDEQFLRHSCAVDSDCAAYNTSCQDLEASITGKGQIPRRMCLGSGDSLLNRFHRTMIAADYQLEVTSLTFSTGRFYESLVNALAYLTHKSNVPKVRLLFSGKIPVTLNVFSRPAPVLSQLLRDVARRGGDVKRLRIDLGWLSQFGQPTWNHAKIIVADQNQVLTGGHNPWDADYLSEQPIFDLSLEARGPLGNGVARYVQRLWEKADARASYSFSAATPTSASDPDGVDRFETQSPMAFSNLEAKSEGKSPIIGIGRLGYNPIQSNKSSNASDEALRVLIDAAKNNLWIAQQDVYKGLKIFPDVLPSFAFEAMYNAMTRGVKISIVKSAQDSAVGYGMVDPEKSYKAMLNHFKKAAQRNGFIPPAGQNLEAYICDHVELAPWRFTASEATWPDGTKIGAHSKLIIVDDASFYIGSQNLYPSNLEEFGVIVGDIAVTKTLVDQYWTPLYNASHPNRLNCEY